MQPEIDLLGLPVKTFGLCFAIAFLAAGAVLTRRFRELRWPGDQATEALLAALVGGLVGARAYWLIDNWSEAQGDLVGSLFGGSGLTWYGGALGGALAVLAWARWRDHLNARLLDAAAPALALGYAIGRVGCQVSGDGDYGRASDLPWAMAYPDGVVPTDEVVQPTPIYETLSMGLAALVLWQLRDRLPAGALFGLYLVFAGVERFVVEFWRRNPDVDLGLTTAQVTSLGMLVVGTALVVWRLRVHRPQGPRAAAS
ncbi:prolipoprotein diacylglyceryl transferase [Patulibacter sp.]|uniref:prolipoprotein diacylglyceryl transferase n=1 Tax=Patulibacter sp. TaxID=1912859 RepID=UPI00271A3547|nr:prolipoprotein diacylglyceryl transferase family protein [Patulibacter sp.]MDO9408681.1 prolipoprotein diacylglyceryl transferase [Patulibacter sp.]